MIYLISILIMSFSQIFSFENNAIYMTDEDEIDYLYIDGSWYLIEFIERIWPIRYGD